MANITIKQLKPIQGILRIKHPILKTKVLDVNTGLETEESVDIFPLPDGTEGPLELYLVGRNSKQWADFMKSLKSVGADQKDIFSKISDEAHIFVSSLIVGWLNNGAIDEPYSPEAALDLISKPENIWIIEQIQSFLLDESHFFLTT